MSTHDEIEAACIALAAGRAPDPEPLPAAPVKAVADKTAAHIAAAMKNGNGSAEIVELKKSPA